MFSCDDNFLSSQPVPPHYRPQEVKKKNIPEDDPCFDRVVSHFKPVLLLVTQNA
jgi:hypothetical protein